MILSASLAFAGPRKMSKDLEGKNASDQVDVIVQFTQAPTARHHQKVLSCGGTLRQELGLVKGGAYSVVGYLSKGRFMGVLYLGCTQLIDVMKVESLGGNKYAFDFGGGPERIAVDGTDQQAVQGTILSVTIEGPDSWKVVRKKDGRTLLTATWKISQNGNTLTDNYTEFAANGSPSTVNYLYKRTAAGTGFAGTWESAIPMTSTFVLQIRPYEENGLSFIRSPQDTRNLKFDGKDYPVEGRGVAQGSTSSARRVDERTLEIINKVNGEITGTEQRELSPDLQTLTRTVHPIGQRDPNIFVFERQ